MIEVELKARVPDHNKARHWLDQRAPAEASVYRDTYYDWPDRTLERNGRQELRVRVIEDDDNNTVVLTYKGTMFDTASTPEHETVVAERPAIDAILRGLGLTPMIAYDKQCLNYRFPAHGHEITATLVQVPELGGTGFIEIETLIPDDCDRTPATKAIHDVLTDMGLGPQDLEPTFYIDLVRQHRSAQDLSAAPSLGTKLHSSGP